MGRGVSHWWCDGGWTFLWIALSTYLPPSANPWQPLPCEDVPQRVFAFRCEAGWDVRGRGARGRRLRLGAWRLPGGSRSVVECTLVLWRAMSVQIKTRARCAQFDFNQPEWASVSYSAKDLLRKLIVKNPAVRSRRRVPVASVPTQIFFVVDCWPTGGALERPPRSGRLTVCRCCVCAWTNNSIGWMLGES